jgi:hypothetical protein
MTLKQRAALQTAAIIGAAVAGALIVNLILENLTRDQIINGLAIGSIVLLIYSMYGVVLSRLEYNEKLKEITEKNPTLR